MGMHCKTPQIYKEIIKSAWKTRNNYDVRVTDVFAIPDFAVFLRENLDKTYSRFSKLD